MSEHPKTWWFRIAERIAPGRCREIPEAVNPDRIVLRQVAIWKRHVYLQQFASSEDPAWQHSHQWVRTIAIGLWGGYLEQRIDKWRPRTAPYCYTMDEAVIHRVHGPSKGHTAIFVGLWRDDDMKRYYPSDVPSVLWSDHIRNFVKRI